MAFVFGGEISKLLGPGIAAAAACMLGAAMSRPPLASTGSGRPDVSAPTRIDLADTGTTPLYPAAESAQHASMVHLSIVRSYADTHKLEG